jgi:type II secretory pathway pseudopilin PulG
MLAGITIPNVLRATQATTRNQTKVNQAWVVCGLERYRLAHCNYPENLEALVPQFLDKLPHDVIGGGPLKYRRTDDGKFRLYSVGWDEQDNGGTPGKDSDSGDWVWTTAAK